MAARVWPNRDHEHDQAQGWARASASSRRTATMTTSPTNHEAEPLVATRTSNNKVVKRA